MEVREQSRAIRAGYPPIHFLHTVKDDDSVNAQTVARTRVWTPLEQLRQAREILLIESRALGELAGRLDGSFCQAAERLFRCQGNIIVTGMGKAGLVGRKIAATLASTGTPAHYLHPAEAIHGDLGRIRRDDVLLTLSQSGETEEVVRLLPAIRQLGIPIVAVTASRDSTLGRAGTVVLELGRLEEADSLGLAPSTSTTAMLAIGDALALVTSRMRGFRPDDFARFHPGGSLGRRLSKVEDQMRPIGECRVASADRSVRDVLVEVSVPGRRTGAIMLVDCEGRLVGIFTDSDLARLFEHRRDDALDRPVCKVMTSNPVRAVCGTMLSEAVATLAQRKISELPIVDAECRPVGLLDVTDIVGLFPQDPVGVEAEGVTPNRMPHCRIFPELGRGGAA